MSTIRKRASRSTRSILILAGPVAALLAMQTAHAVNYFWDIDGALTGAGGASPAGAWSSGGTTWSTNPNGILATSAYTTLSSDDLFFSAGVGATGAYTVALVDAQNAGSLNFQEGLVTISGSGGVVTLGGTGSVVVNNGATATIGANTDTVLGGSAGLTKSGLGSLTLSSTVANTFIGGVRVNGGSLVLDFANMATPTDLVAATNALGLGGGNLVLRGKGSGSTTTQTFGGVTVNSGGGSILANPNGDTSTTLNLGALTSTASGGSLRVGRALSSGAGTLEITTTTDKDATGVYGGRVVFANGTAGTGFDWATNTGVGPNYVLAAYAGYTALATGGGVEANNSRVSVSATLSGSVTTNSLKFENPATAQTLTVGTGNTLTLENGGLLFTGNSVAQGPRIAGGSITAGNASGSFDLLLHVYNITAQNIATGITGTNLGLVNTISSDIVDNAGNPVTLVKNGPGNMMLSGPNNTFSGGIVINEGNMAFNTLTAINNNAITVNASTTIHTFGGSSTSGQVTLNNNSLMTLLNNNSSFTISGKVTGTGGIGLAQGGQGSITVNLTSLANDFTGPIRFLHTQFRQSAHLTVASLVDTAAIGEGNIVLGAAANAGNQGIVSSHNFNYSAAAVAPLTLNGRQFELGTTQIMQQINNNSAQPFTINTDLLVSGTGFKALTLGGTGSGLNTFAGAITQGSATVSVTKDGSGTWNLSGLNSFAGSARVAAGILNINSVANAGSPSSIGQSLSPAGLVLSGGTLRYAPIASTGAGAASTDRNFVITGSTTLDASGTGPIVFSAPAGGAISPDVTGLTGTWAVSNANIITAISSTANLAPGMRVIGNGIPTGTVIVAIASATSVTISAQPTIAGTNAPLTFGSPTARTLTLTGTNDGANTIGGNLQDSSAAGVGVLSVAKTGGGTWVLGGINTYTGTTTVNAGTLVIGGSITGSATVSAGTLQVDGSVGGSVTVNAGTLFVNGSITGGTTVNSGGLLGGTGNAGPTLINTGGTIAPGSSVGTLNTGVLSFNGGTFELEIDTTAITTDLVNVSGSLNLLGSASLNISDFNVSSTPLPFGQVFTFIDYSGTWDGGTFTGYADDSDFVLGLNQYRISYDGVDNATSAVTLQVIPEPGSAVLLLGGLAAMAGFRRRRGN